MYLKDKDHKLFVRISSKDYNNLLTISKDYNISVSDLVRNILKAYLYTFK